MSVKRDNPAVRRLRRSSFVLGFGVVLVISTLLFPARTSAQRKQRPKLLPATRNYFDGKIVLIPRGARLQQLRMLAQIADQDLLLPPSRLLDPRPQPEKLVEWMTGLNLTETNGVIISLETIAAEAAPEKLPARLRAIRQLRAQQPKLPIYGLAALDSSDSSKQICQTALELVADGTLSYLVLGQNEDLSAKPAQITRARLIGQIASRQIETKVAIDDDPTAAAATLISRLIARHFDQAPRVLPVYSSVEGRHSTESRDTIALDQSIRAKVKLAGAAMPMQESETTPSADIVLFVHAPQTDERQREALARTIAQTIEKGARVAVVDLSESKSDKEALLAALRSQKLLDRLISYAASRPGGDSSTNRTRAAVNRALAQTVVHFTALKMLRNDLDRVHRIDRAQVTLLFNRYLEDWGYNLVVRPKLDQYLRDQVKADPAHLGESVERAEKFAFDELHPIAETLFEEQFRRNSHAILLNSGERAQFRISLLQRLQIRLDSRDTAEADIKQSIHTFYEGMLQVAK